MRRAILTACDLGYMPGARAMLASAARHHPEAERLCMVPEPVAAQAREILGDLARVIVPPRRLSGVVERYQIAYARAFISELTDYDAVVWTDGDALYCRPAPELWEVRPGRVNVARCFPDNRVPHNLPPELRHRFTELYPAIAATPGFNSGVFGLRPADWPDLAGRIERMLVTLGCPDHGSFFDQPLFNVVFDGAADYLDPVFNWTEMFDRPPPAGRVRVVHFASRPKPWEAGYPRHEPGYWYWVRHGLGETDRLALARVRGWVLVNTPRRLVSGGLRRLARRLASARGGR